MPSNIPVNPTAQKLRFWVPSSLRLPASGYLQRWASERDRTGASNE